MEQRNFATMGQNLFLILMKLTKNQDLCRLLHYTDRNPLSANKADINGNSLIHKNFLVVPKLPDDLSTKENYIVAGYGPFYINPENNEFKISNLEFTIVCPYDDWVLDTNSLRPFLIMGEIDRVLNRQKISGIGKIKLSGAKPVALSSELGGFSMVYVNDEFN